MRNPDVVCIGVALMDLPVGPITKEALDRETTMVKELRLTTGGDAFNQSVILSRLGQRVALVGQIGKDLLGDRIVETCHQEGIDTGNLIQDDKVQTRINVVLVQENGQRTFVKTTDGSGGSIPLTDIDFEQIKRAKALSLASIFSSKLKEPQLILSLLKTAKENGVLTFADAVPMKDDETLEQIASSLPFLDYFMPNEEEASKLTGEREPEAMAAHLLRHGIGTVVIKMGKKGCFVKDQKESRFIPAFEAQAVDTTGAGDNFAAGFIHSILRGEDRMESARFGNLIAAISTESIGAVTGVTDAKTVTGWEKAHS